MTDAELVARYDGRVPRYTSYPTAPHFSPAVGAADLRRLARRAAGRDAAVALSARAVLRPALPVLRLQHHAWCGSNSSRRAYAALLEREIARSPAFIGRRAHGVATSIGAAARRPRLPGDRLTAIMARIRELLRRSRRTPRSPSSSIRPRCPTDRLDALARDGRHPRQPRRAGSRARGAGGDRPPAILRADGGLRRKARGLGVGSLNLDLIYGLPLQTEESVARTARRALALDADRVAVFGYAHVPWMKKHQALIPEESAARRRRALRPAARDPRVLTEEGGYIPVGLDHYARPGDAMAEAAASRRLQARLPGLHHRRRAGADRLRRQRDRLAAAGLCAERADRARLRQGDRGGRAWPPCAASR